MRRAFRSVALAASSVGCGAPRPFANGGCGARVTRGTNVSPNSGASAARVDLRLRHVCLGSYALGVSLVGLGVGSNDHEALVSATTRTGPIAPR